MNILLCFQDTKRVYSLSQMYKSGFCVCILWFHSLLFFTLNMSAFRSPYCNIKLWKMSLQIEVGFQGVLACLVFVLMFLMNFFSCIKKPCNWDKITHSQIFWGCFSSWIGEILAECSILLWKPQRTFCRRGREVTVHKQAWALSSWAPTAP